jgi:hypothetical protein
LASKKATKSISSPAQGEEENGDANRSDANVESRAATKRDFAAIVEPVKEKEITRNEEEEEDDDDDDDDDEEFGDKEARRGEADDEEEEADADDDDGDDEESFRGRKKSNARKSSAASPAAGAAPAAPAVRAKKATRGTKRSGGAGAGGVESSSALVEALRSNSALAVLVSEWHADFQQKGNEAMLALVNSLLEIGGSNLALSLAQYMEESSDDLKRATVSTTSDYAVHGKAKAAVHLRARLDQFWARVATTVVRGETDDTKPLDLVVIWLTSISSSSLRPFRHTATLAALAVARAVAKVAHEDIKLLAVARRQSAASQKRGAGKSGGGAAAEDELARRVSRYDLLLSDLFDGVLVHRYRDSVADIRAACATAFGALMLAHADAFLEDKYLKYLGWLLHDREPMVREATIDALRVVYEEHADTQKLTNFSVRFKSRVLEMADDKDETVAAAAVALCLHLAQIPDVLVHDEVVQLYHRTTDSRPRVRAAAARFANNYFLETVVPENIAAGEDLQEAQIKALVELVVEFTSLPENPAYVVDAIFTSAPALSAWSKIARLLEAPAACDLEPSDALPLARILSAAARKASGDVIVPGGTALGGQKLHKKQRDAVDLARSAIARELGSALPKLFANYAADAGVVAELAELVPCMDLSHAASRTSLKALADSLADAFARAVVPETVVALARSLRYALVTPHTHVSEFASAHAALTEQLDAAVVAAIDAVLTKHSAANAANALVALQRLAALRAQIAPPTTESTADVVASIERLLADGGKGANASPQLCVAAVGVYTPLLMWRAREATAALAAARKGTPAKKKRVDDDDEDVDNKIGEDEDEGGDNATLDAARLKVAALGVPRDAAFGYVERLLKSELAGVRREAFQHAATLAMVFTAQRPRNALSTALPESLAGALDAHADAVLRVAEADVAEWYEPIAIDPADAADELDDLQADTMSTYAALVLAGALDATRVVRVYRLFVHPSKRVQAVARVLQKRLRDSDPRLEFEWINRTLEAVFEEAVAAEPDAREDEVRDLRDVHTLAVRLAQSYGIGQVPPRLVRSLALVVVEGISYATQPIGVAVQSARDAGDADLDEVAARPELKARLGFIAQALEPFAARLTASVAARVLGVAKESAERLHLDVKLHPEFFDFIQQLDGATKGRRIKSAAATPATALIKKSLKLDASTSKKAPLSSAKATKKPKRKAAWEDDDTTTAVAPDLNDDDDDGDDERAGAAPPTIDRPRRAAASVAVKKNRTALHSDGDTEDNGDAAVFAQVSSASTSPAAAAAVARADIDDDALVSAIDSIDPDADIDDKLLPGYKARAGALSQEPMSQSVDAGALPKASVASTVVPRVMTRRKK